MTLPGHPLTSSRTLPTARSRNYRNGRETLRKTSGTAGCSNTTTVPRSPTWDKQDEDLMTIPPSTEPGRHGWAELLTLLGAVRVIAFDSTMPPIEALGRIRDQFTGYDS